MFISNIMIQFNIRKRECVIQQNHASPKSTARLSMFFLSSIYLFILLQIDQLWQVLLQLSDPARAPPSQETRRQIVADCFNDERNSWIRNSGKNQEIWRNREIRELSGKTRKNVKNLVFRACCRVFSKPWLFKSNLRWEYQRERSQNFDFVHYCDRVYLRSLRNLHFFSKFFNFLLFFVDFSCCFQGKNQEIRKNQLQEICQNQEIKEKSGRKSGTLKKEFLSSLRDTRHQTFKKKKNSDFFSSSIFFGSKIVIKSVKIKVKTLWKLFPYTPWFRETEFRDIQFRPS